MEIENTKIITEETLFEFISSILKKFKRHTYLLFIVFNKKIELFDYDNYEPLWASKKFVNINQKVLNRLFKSTITSHFLSVDSEYLYAAKYEHTKHHKNYYPLCRTDCIKGIHYICLDKSLLLYKICFHYKDKILEEVFDVNYNKFKIYLKLAYERLSIEDRESIDAFRSFSEAIYDEKDTNNRNLLSKIYEEYYEKVPNNLKLLLEIE